MWTPSVMTHVNTHFEHVPQVGVFIGKIPEYIGLSNTRPRIRIGFLRRAKLKRRIGRSGPLCQICLSQACTRDKHMYHAETHMIVHTLSLP